VIIPSKFSVGAGLGVTVDFFFFLREGSPEEAPFVAPGDVFRLLDAMGAGDPDVDAGEAGALGSSGRSGEWEGVLRFFWLVLLD
jgi:hypothetical protein